jgi:AraC-like DNA-binding protein
MDEHRKILTMQLRRLIDEIGIQKVVIAEKDPEVPLPREILPSPRIIVPLSGEKEIFYTIGKQVVRGVLKPGDALFVPSLCCTRRCWNKPHEMISIVFYKNMLRILYIDSKGNSDSPEMQPVPDAFYHVKYYQEATGFMFKALSSINSRNAQCITKLVECLFQFSLEDLENSSVSESYSQVSCASWPWIVEYIHNNITEDITREHVAKRFSLTPQYISKLFRKNTRFTFKAYITAERMKRAVELLERSNLTVDEISWECGFPYTSYFIKVFRKYYDISPGSFRRQSSKHAENLD